MRTSAIFLKCLLIAALLMSACKSLAGPAVTLVKSPTGNEPAGTQPAGAVVAQTGEATATPPPGADIYNNAEWGVTVYYPKGWETQKDDQNANILTWILKPDSSVMVIVFAAATGAGDTLETAASGLSQSFLQSLSDIQTLSDGTTHLNDGREAWETISTGVRASDNAKLKIIITTTLAGARMYSVLIFGRETNIEQNQDSIALISGSLHISTAQLYGISRDQALVLAGGESTNPREYDPATTHGSGDKLVYSGLVAFDPQLNLIPDLAESWQVTDGVIYTFKLRTNAHFHDGRPVTAQDFVYSWERAADPKTGSDTVLTYLGDIVGVKEMNKGKANRISGLKVIDDHTLQVTIDAPKPYFLEKLTYPTGFVLDQKNVESGNEWYRTPNGTGPYRLKSWERFKDIIYERNSDYYLEPPAIPYVIVQLFLGVGIRLYETGEIDVTGVGRVDVPRVEDPKDPLHNDLLSGVNLCTGYVVFDNGQPPFDDPKVRQAFTMAFNRQKYIDVVMDGVALPAVGLFPPGLPGWTADLKGLPYDPAQARKLLAESKYGGPQGLPPIVYTDGGLGSDVGPSVAALVQMWQQTLGITITIENLEPDHYLDEIKAGNHGQIWDGGWCADYPDPENFADVLFHTGAQQNDGHYSNPQVDTLLEQARVEPDVAKRMQLYQQAQQLIVNDAPVLFTVHSLSYVLVKPYIQGYVLTAVDVPLERYLKIDPSKLP